MKAALAAAMPALKEDMADCLAQHVQADVYDAYTPLEYQRRGDNGGLIDINGSADFAVGTDRVEMVYLPSGESEQAENPIYGDELISRIENRNPDYDWRRKPDKRPFFSRFVDEMIEGNRAEETVVNAMNRADPELGVTADGLVGRDGDEGI